MSTRRPVFRLHHVLTLPPRISILGVAQDVAHDASTKVAQSLILRARECLHVYLSPNIALTSWLVGARQKHVKHTVPFSQNRRSSYQRAPPYLNPQMSRWRTHNRHLQHLEEKASREETCRLLVAMARNGRWTKQDAREQTPQYHLSRVKKGPGWTARRARRRKRTRAWPRRVDMMYP